MLTYQFAWVLAHLCGAYRDHICNVEVSGIGAYSAGLEPLFHTLATAYLAEDPNDGDLRYLLAANMMRNGQFKAAADTARVTAIQTAGDCRLQCLRARALLRGFNFPFRT